MSMRRILPSIAIVLALAASAEGEVKRSQYLVAIGSQAQKSTVTAFGATIDADLNDTWLVSVDPAKVELLRSLPGVRYVQRVVVPNAEVPAAPEPQATAFTSNQHHAGAYSLTWASGDYGYDGVGNVTSIGTGNSYWYDGDSRLMHATTAGHTQDYSYDGFGNMTAMTTDSQPHSLATTMSTNRLNANLYDVAGNVKRDEFGYDYVYDAFNMIQDKRQGLEIDVYDGSDERIGMLRNGKWTWTLRDESGKVLREYQTSDATPSAPALWLGDYVWRDGLMAGSQRVVEEGGARHYHLDHLGTPRLITGTGGAVIARHDFYPYGGEITPSNPDTLAGMREDTFRFTGHERDFNSLASGDTDYLDYMHARYYNPNGAAFLTADPITDMKRATAPQLWNRYRYAGDNPLRYVDKDGEDITDFVNALRPATSATGHDLVQLGKDAIHYDAVREAFAGFSTAPANEQALAIAVGTIAALDIAANLLEPEKAGTGRAVEEVTNFGYKSFSSFKRAMGAAGTGSEWHHIVEQTSKNVSEFGAQALHNNVNLVRIDRATHRRISAFYSSKVKGLTGDLTVRQWLAKQSFKDQYEFGLKVLRDFQVLK